MQEIPVQGIPNVLWQSFLLQGNCMSGSSFPLNVLQGGYGDMREANCLHQFQFYFYHNLCFPGEYHLQSELQAHRFYYCTNLLQYNRIKEGLGLPVMIHMQPGINLYVREE